MEYELYKMLRDSRGLKDADVARGTGLSPVVLCDWKRGKATPKRDKMKKIEDFLGVDEYGLPKMSETDLKFADMCRDLYERLYPEEVAIENALDEAIAERIADNEEFEILKKYRMLDQLDKQKIEGYFEALLSSDKYKKETVQDSKIG